MAAVFLTLGTSNRVVVLCELFDRALHDLLCRHLRKEIALFLHFFSIMWRKKRRFIDEQKKETLTERREEYGSTFSLYIPVSYTHLTLPTILLV